jgi:hypothetical protein
MTLIEIRPHRALELVSAVPAVAAGLEETPWSLEKVVEMTEAYWLMKRQFPY